MAALTRSRLTDPMLSHFGIAFRIAIFLLDVWINLVVIIADLDGRQLCRRIVAYETRVVAVAGEVAKAALIVAQRKAAAVVASPGFSPGRKMLQLYLTDKQQACRSQNSRRRLNVS